MLLRERKKNPGFCANERELSVLFPIAFGGARLSNTAWRSKPPRLVLGLKNAFANLKAETPARVIGTFVARLYCQKYLYAVNGDFT